MPGKLRFRKDEVREHVVHSASCDEHASEEPGLWLFAGPGVGLISTGLPPFNEKAGYFSAVFAEGFNPYTDPIDQWYLQKLEVFGADNVREAIPLEVFSLIFNNDDEYFYIDVTDQHIALGVKRPDEDATTNEEVAD